MWKLVFIVSLAFNADILCWVFEKKRKCTFQFYCMSKKKGGGAFSYNLFEIPSLFSFSMCCRCILPQWQCFLLQLSLCFYLTFTCPLHFSSAQRKLPLASCIFHNCVFYYQPPNSLALRMGICVVYYQPQNKLSL